MVSGQWKYGAKFAIYNNFCSTTICDILAPKIDINHNQNIQRMNQNPPDLQSDGTFLSSHITMVDGWWESDAYFAINKQICSTTIWAILATKIDGEHNQHMDQNPPKFQIDQASISCQITMVSGQ